MREVEYGSFIPFVLSATGGMGKAAGTTHKRLASLIAAKRDEAYRMVMGWIWCKITFSLLHSAILCLRGSRSLYHSCEVRGTLLDLASAEGGIPKDF